MVLQGSKLRHNLLARFVVAFIVTLLISQFLAAQLDIIHFRYKPLPTAAVCAVFFLGSLRWPVTHHRSTRSSIAAAGVSLVVFFGMLLLVDGLGGHGSFLIHKRQRALGTVASMVKLTRAPSIEEVLHGDGLQGTVAESQVHGVTTGVGGPPIVLLVVDTWRADTMSHWGGSGQMMPHMEALARQSVVFTDVLSNAPWTKPSMASMMTGMTPERAGVLARDDVLGSDLVTVAEAFREAGYATAAFVTNPQLFRGSGYDQGFDVFKPIPDHRGYLPAEDLLERFDKWTDNSSFSGDSIFVYLHLMDPHFPYQKPEQRSARFRRHSQHLYQDEVEYFDDIFDRFVLKFYDVFGPETVLVIVSDHGEEFDDHGQWGHGDSVFPELTRIPLMVQGKGFEPGTIGARLQGRDVFGLLRWLMENGDGDIEAWAWSRSREVRVMSSYHHVASGWRRFLRPYRTRRIRAVETEDWLLARSAFGSVDELYDLRSDPECMRNVAREHPEVVAQLWKTRNAQVATYRVRQSQDMQLKEKQRLEALGYVQ